VAVEPIQELAWITQKNDSQACTVHTGTSEHIVDQLYEPGAHILSLVDDEESEIV
jgi:hypothetical protein